MYNKFIKIEPPIKLSRSATSGIFFCIIIVFSLLIYSNTLDVPFYFDDFPYILEDPAIKMTRLDWSSLWQAAMESVPKHRPLSNISFALNYYAGQYNITGYHGVNIAIHILTAIFLYLFILTTLRNFSPPWFSFPPRMVAFAATMLWAANPIHTESVTYIVQRMTSLAAMFYILCLWLYAAGRSSWSSRMPERIKSLIYFFGCLLAGICAVASKENAAILPVFIILYEWFFVQDLKFSLSKQKIFILLIAFTVFIAFAYIYLGANPFARILSAYNMELSPTQRLMTEWRIIIYYISLLFFPMSSRLTIEYSYPLSNVISNPMTTLSCLSALICMIIFAVYSAKKERVIAFCILWFLLNLIIESSIIGLEIIFEHRTYLPSMLMNLFFTLLLFRLFRHKAIPLSVLCAIILFFSLITYQRNTTWQTPLNFWADCVEKAPYNYRAHHNYGLVLSENGKITQAITHYQNSLDLSPADLSVKGFKDKAYNNLGNALAQTGRLNEAIKNFKSAININPKSAVSYYNLATALANIGKIDKSIAHYQTALTIDPNNADTHNNLAMMFVQKKQYDDAIRNFKTAIKINPQHINANINLGKLYIEKGQLEQALTTFYYMLNQNPLPDQFILVGKSLININQLEAAEKIFKLAIQKYPKEVWPYNNLAYVLAGQNKINEAINCFEKILAINPDSQTARGNLAYLRSLTVNKMIK